MKTEEEIKILNDISQFESNNNIQNVVINNIYTLNNDELLLIQKDDSTGLYIYDKQSGFYLEKVPNAKVNLPKNKKLFYFGPMNYYFQENNELIHIVDKNIKLSFEEANEINNDFSKKLNLIRLNYLNGQRKNLNKNDGWTYNPNDFNNYKGNLIKEGNAWYVPGYLYFRNDPFPENTNGNCGYVASAILLNWWNKTKEKIIPDKFLDNSGNLITYGYTLVDELLAIGKKMGYDETTYSGKQTAKILNKFCQKYNIKGSSWWHLFNTGLITEIIKGYPAIAMGKFRYSTVDPNDSNFDHNIHTEKRLNKGHVVVVYGMTDDYYIVNYGWRGFENVYLYDHLYGGSVFFRLKG
ncbi:hypothetical protein [Mycoplasma seminis]|uniref:Peptidase C39-like domain-containing protein n=1 Tax=Mycoplasma seminis TaxID=512749 RepID=A0ABY9HA93_9MOLU|nr:hypothetical protein [Mycoplasma seminis]WLP85524.1 hypothetical protein Q8852_04380 [Mycoplasma seminis]